MTINDTIDAHSYYRKPNEFISFEIIAVVCCIVIFLCKQKQSYK